MGAWEDAKAAALTRAKANQALLERGLGSQDLNREVQAQRSFGTTPLKPKAPDTMDFQDLGEKEAGSSLKQAARGRAIAQSLRENRSSVSDLQSHEAPTETDLHAGGRPWVPQSRYGSASSTDTGESAGAFGFKSDTGRAPADLGRATAKVVRGDYGEVSPKTMGQIKGSFLGRAAESVAGKLGSAAGMYGVASLAAKASSAYKGMKQGQAVSPLTLETRTPAEGESVLTPTGPKKAPKPPEQM